MVTFVACGYRDTSWRRYRWTVSKLTRASLTLSPREVVGLPLTLEDTDADGRLTRPEFVEVMKSSVTSPENFESAVLVIAAMPYRPLSDAGVSQRVPGGP
jgi:hypothetical protein